MSAKILVETRVSESKRFYAMFGIGANLAMLPSGELIKYFAKVGNNVNPGVDGFGLTFTESMRG